MSAISVKNFAVNWFQEILQRLLDAFGMVNTFKNSQKKQ